MKKVPRNIFLLEFLQHLLTSKMECNVHTLKTNIVNQTDKLKHERRNDKKSRPKGLI